MKKHLFLLIAVCVSMMFALEFSSIKNIYKGPTERPANWKTPSHNFEIIDEWEVDLKPGQYVLFSPASETDSGEPKIIMEEGKNRAYHIHDGEMELVPFAVSNRLISENCQYIAGYRFEKENENEENEIVREIISIAELNDHDMQITSCIKQGKDMLDVISITSSGLLLCVDERNDGYILVDQNWNEIYRNNTFGKYAEFYCTVRSSPSKNRSYIKVGYNSQEFVDEPIGNYDGFMLYIHNEKGGLINTMQIPGDFEMKPSTTGAYCWLSMRELQESWLIDGQGNIIQKFEYLTCFGWSPQDDFCYLNVDDPNILATTLNIDDLKFYEGSGFMRSSGVNPPYQVRAGVESVYVQNYINEQMIIRDTPPKPSHAETIRGKKTNNESAVSISGDGKTVCVFIGGLVRKYRIGSEK